MPAAHHARDGRCRGTRWGSAKGAITRAFLKCAGGLRAPAARSRLQGSHACGGAIRCRPASLDAGGGRAPGCRERCARVRETGSGACPCLRAAQEAALSRARPASRPTHSAQPFAAVGRVLRVPPPVGASLKYRSRHTLRKRRLSLSPASHGGFRRRLSPCWRPPPRRSLRASVHPQHPLASLKYRCVIGWGQRRLSFVARRFRRRPAAMRAAAPPGAGVSGCLRPFPENSTSPRLVPSDCSLSPLGRRDGGDPGGGCPLGSRRPAAP
jgi:hypothetical protein